MVVRRRVPARLLDDSFSRWLVAFTDGDGCFSIIQQGGQIQTSKFGPRGITQSTYNEQILDRTKKQLKAQFVYL